jgi:hypothetical protein
MSCAQIATIPMNSVSDASAAASSTKTFSITASFTLNTHLEHNKNNVLFLFQGVKMQERADAESIAGKISVG